MRRALEKRWTEKRGGDGGDAGGEVGLVAFPFHDDPLMNLTTIKPRAHKTYTNHQLLNSSLW